MCVLLLNKESMLVFAVEVMLTGADVVVDSLMLKLVVVVVAAAAAAVAVIYGLASTMGVIERSVV